VVEPEMVSSETGSSDASFYHPMSVFTSIVGCFFSPENRKYGSGYPGYPIGVAGYGFPFFFWPLAFGGTYIYGAHYIHENEVRGLSITFSLSRALRDR